MSNPSTPVPQVLMWDWRESPSPAEIKQVIEAASGGRMTAIEIDTGGDDYAVVVGPAGLSAERAYATYEKANS